MTKRQPFDTTRPDTQALVESITHGAAVTEGTMVAFPTCFPAVTIPVTADESRITAMDVTANGIVYAGTSGWASHLLLGMFHGITGIVFDMGTVPNANQCTAICCGQKSCVAAVNGSDGGRLILRDLQPLPFDLLQEWGIARRPLNDLGAVVRGEAIIHAVANSAHTLVVGATTGHLFTFDFATAKVETIADIAGQGRLVRGPGNSIYGRDAGDTLWRFHAEQKRLDRKAVALPKGDWSLAKMMWAGDERGTGVYTIDATGKLFHFGPSGFSGPLATIPLQPIGAMAVTHDGRLFVSAGDGIARLFCFQPATAKVADLGVAVSVIQQRRYGYCFGDAVVGRDGEIIFGENDDLGHVWLYFPSILKRGT